VEPAPACPISGAVGVLGDRWSLLVLRDVIFHDRRYFRALLSGSAEGIATNILADRLVRLVDAGILTRGTAARGQRAQYGLTEAGIQTVPVLCALANWGLSWRPAGDELAQDLTELRNATADDLAELMDELRVRHLGADRGREPLSADRPAGSGRAG
jgi:DNA-binding HxlR family transcriptional regulator